MLGGRRGGQPDLLDDIAADAGPAAQQRADDLHARRMRQRLCDAGNLREVVRVGRRVSRPAGRQGGHPEHPFAVRRTTNRAVRDATQRLSDGRGQAFAGETPGGRDARPVCGEPARGPAWIVRPARRQTSIIIGFSRFARMASRNCAPSAPSITRWSTDSVTDMTVAIADRAVCHHRLLDACPDRQDRGVRRVDDGVEVVDAEHAQVRDGEAAALVLLRLQLALAGARGEVLHFGGDLRQPLGVRVLDDRGQQPALDGHRDGHVGRLELQHAVAGPDGVRALDAHQRHGAGLDDEVVDRQLDARGAELLVQRLAQRPAACRAGCRGAGRNAGSSAWPGSAGSRWSCACRPA